MKIRFTKDVLVEVQKIRLFEVWDKQYRRWDELIVEAISYNGKNATIYTAERDLIEEVPTDSFEVIT